MSQKISLTTQKRSVEGKKVKTLRRQGILPANVFGKGIKSHAIQLPVAEFLKVYRGAGETHLIELKVGDTVHNVLVHNLQVDPVTDAPLHVDFQAVSLKENISATVPIKVVGESPAEKDKIGIFVQQLSEIEVEALPTDLPDHLEADVSKLDTVGSVLYVKDLKFDSATVTIKPEDLEKIVAKVEPPAKEEVVTPPPTVEVAPTEGEAPAEGAPAAAAEPAPNAS
jgi:large subunit ribosomal protein L25